MGQYHDTALAAHDWNLLVKDAVADCLEGTHRSDMRDGIGPEDQEFAGEKFAEICREYDGSEPTTLQTAEFVAKVGDEARRRYAAWAGAQKVKAFWDDQKDANPPGWVFETYDDEDNLTGTSINIMWNGPDADDFTFDQVEEVRAALAAAFPGFDLEVAP
ncbi:MAG: hypothetical protein RIR00_2053 [Pseudomonadota bacterium]